VLGTPPALILSQDQTLMLSASIRHRGKAATAENSSTRKADCFGSCVVLTSLSSL
jgi:hypothetical protein